MKVVKAMKREWQKGVAMKKGVTEGVAKKKTEGVAIKKKGEGVTEKRNAKKTMKITPTLQPPVVAKSAPP